MKGKYLYLLILFISFSFNSCKQELSSRLVSNTQVNNSTNRADSILISELQERSKNTFHKHFEKTDPFLSKENEKIMSKCKFCEPITKKLISDSFLDSVNYIHNDLSTLPEAPSTCRSLDIQLDTQLDSIKKIQKIANISRKEEGYSEARDLKINQASVFFHPNAQEKGKISFKISLGTVGFLHSHTLSEQTRGFYSLADVKVFLYLLDITYKGIIDGKVKTYTMYDLYSTLIYGNQIYTMRIDNLGDFKKFYLNENNLKNEIIKKMDEIYKNPNVHFNFFKNDFRSDPDENQEALNYLSYTILSKIGIKVYKLDNYDRRNKEPKWKMLFPSKVGNGLFVNPC